MTLRAHIAVLTGVLFANSLLAASDDVPVLTVCEVLSNLERYEGASQSGGVSNLQLDNLRLTLINAQAQVKQLAKQIEWSSMIFLTKFCALKNGLFI